MRFEKWQANQDEKKERIFFGTFPTRKSLLMTSFALHAIENPLLFL